MVYKTRNPKIEKEIDSIGKEMKKSCGAYQKQISKRLFHVKLLKYNQNIDTLLVMIFLG